MSKVRFVLPDQLVETVEVEQGMSLMRAAVEHGVDGIVGECGGSAMCGTCHIYIDPAFAGRVKPADLVEMEMLDAVSTERRPTSRLSCQVIMGPELEGLTVEVPSA